jgi:hypothetical protein
MAPTKLYYLPELDVVCVAYSYDNGLPQQQNRHAMHNVWIYSVSACEFLRFYTYCICRTHNTVFSSFMTYHLVLSKSNMTGATSGAGTA